MAKEELKIEFTLTDYSLKRLFSAFEKWRAEVKYKGELWAEVIEEQKEEKEE